MDVQYLSQLHLGRRPEMNQVNSIAADALEEMLPFDDVIMFF